MSVSFVFFMLFLLLSVVDPFLIGMWGLGLISLLSGLMVFNNLSVEVVSELMWNSGLTAWLVVLGVWVGSICYLCTGYRSVGSAVFFSYGLLFLTYFCVLVFMVSGWFLFFFFFESSLAPIVFLILGWGYQPERLQAAFYLVMYTMCVSLPMLIVLVYMCSMVGSSSFYYNFDWGWEMAGSVVVMLLLLGSFLVKSPIFLVHLWLPKAHVEAPVSGSMMLAGVLLKFGGYGAILVFYWFSFSSSVFCVCFVVFFLWGGLISGFICVRQVDMKSLIAYSSIGHMSLCLSGVFSCFSIGWCGALLMMVSHGLCSSGLFGLAAYMYKLFMTRALILCSGILSYMPIMSLCWFLLCSSNMSFPPSLSLLAEIFLMVALTGLSLYLMVPIGCMVFMVGIYSLLLYSYPQHGGEVELSCGGKLLGSDYMVMAFLLWVPLNLLTICSDFMVSWL
uniref:NADH dehydrogenase subunit 4 n=1 Tax=Pillucina pisidium (Dunker, 1860) TaxID=244488 RepID=UPI00233EFDF1|nr:NADH dehydrogenase subunit 4 [Pillucina pisidium (Dunker, 1860)]WBR65412.1 NADH dehydrogenase subunit 4 [Pillucina pisidium (Dunker, 1860)]